MFLLLIYYLLHDILQYVSHPSQIFQDNFRYVQNAAVSSKIFGQPTVFP